MAENLVAVWFRPGNARQQRCPGTRTKIRSARKSCPCWIAGSDFICSGFGTIKAYDNSSNSRRSTARRWRLSGPAARLRGGWRADASRRDAAVRRAKRSVEAISAVFEELGLSQPTAAMKVKRGSRLRPTKTDSHSPRDVSFISEAIKKRGINVIDVIWSLPGAAIAMRRRIC